MTIEELKASEEYFIHHTELKTRGVSKWHTECIYPYKGMYGEGYVIEEPHYINFLMNYKYITYYIKKK